MNSDEFAKFWSRLVIFENKNFDFVQTDWNLFTGRKFKFE
jgi:hypothetical protein